VLYLTYINIISLSQWSLALPGLAASGVSDWLDGYFARRGGRHSVLGSYLDPLADKVLVGSVVASLGYSVRILMKSSTRSHLPRALLVTY